MKAIPLTIPPRPFLRRRLIIKNHDLDANRCVMHVLEGDRVIERVTANSPQLLSDFIAAVYPDIPSLWAIRRTRALYETNQTR